MGPCRKGQQRALDPERETLRQRVTAQLAWMTEVLAHNPAAMLRKLSDVNRNFVVCTEGVPTCLNAQILRIGAVRKSSSQNYQSKVMNHLRLK